MITKLSIKITIVYKYNCKQKIYFKDNTKNKKIILKYKNKTKTTIIIMKMTIMKITKIIKMMTNIAYLM